MTPCDQGGRRESSSLGFRLWKGISKNAFFTIASVRPAPVRPEAHSSSIGRFLSTENEGFREERSHFGRHFCPQIDRFVVAKRGRREKSAFFLGGEFAKVNKAGIDSVRARQKAREFFPTPFFLDFICGRGFRETHFSKFARARVRPSRSP